MRRVVLVLVLVLVPAAARADSSVTVTLNDLGRQLAAQYGQSEQQLIAKVQASIEDIYQTQHIGSLLRAFADTAAFAGRGLGADYQTDPGGLTIGIAATGALSSDVSLSSSSHVIGGAVVNFGAVAGESLARWGLPRWTLFASGSYEATTIHGLAGTLWTGGTAAQVQVLEPGAPASVRWTGVAVTGGLQVARWTISETQPIQINFHVTGTSGQKKTVDLVSTGTLAVKASTYTIPIEVTTGVRLLDVLALYGGGGVDLTLGDSSIEAQLAGDLTINADHEPIGTAVITATGTGGPDTFSVHALAGLELHTRHVHVFAQGAITPSEEAVTFGVRAAF